MDKVNAEDEDAVRSPTGTIPLKALDFAIKRCNDYISAQSHEDIDQEAERVWSHQWDQFITWYYQIIRCQALFVRTNVPFNVRYLLANMIFFSSLIHVFLILKNISYLSTEIYPSFEAHIKEDKEILATDRHGRHNEYMDPETWEQESGTRYCFDEQARGCGSKSKSNRQTRHAICRAEIHR